MRILDDPTTRSAFVILIEDSSGPDFMLSDDIIVELTDSGDLACLELLNTPSFGTPFDEAAAKRAVTWVRERLAHGAAS